MKARLVETKMSEKKREIIIDDDRSIVLLLFFSTDSTLRVIVCAAARTGHLFVLRKEEICTRGHDKDTL